MNEQFGQLVDYIKDHLARGVPEANIRQVLLQYNWNADLVEQAFQQARTPAQPLAPVPPQPTYQQPAVQPAYQAQTYPVSQPLAQSAVAAQLLAAVQPTAPSNYGVFRAISDTFKAIVKNFWALLLSAIVGSALLFGLILIPTILLGLTGATHRGVSSLIAIIIIVIVAEVVGEGFLISTASLAVYAGSEGRKISVSQLMSQGLRLAGRAMLATFTLSLVIIGPSILVGLLLLLITLMTGLHGSSILLLGVILWLGTFVWSLIAAFRFALVPFVAVVEPRLPILKTLKRSHNLLSNGGQFFLFKGFLLFAATLMILAAVAGQNLQSTNTGYGVIVILLSLFANGVLVVLYRNRRLVKGNG